MILSGFFYFQICLSFFIKQEKKGIFLNKVQFQHQFENCVDHIFSISNVRKRKEKLIKYLPSRAQAIFSLSSDFFLFKGKK
jgi:hypothetical protein